MMADWRSMEAAVQLWVPCDYPMAEPAAQVVWVPSLTAGQGQQQLVARHAGGATEQDLLDDEVEQTITHNEVAVEIQDNAIHIFEEASLVFDSDIKKMGVKMHRYPISLRPYLDKGNRAPSIVAIGPYYHGLPELQEAEKVKHVAAYHCIKESGYSVQDMYDAVVLDTDYARSLYDKNVVVGISDDDFRPMMFFDACFLAQYMLSCTLDGYSKMDESLRNYFEANDDSIFTDVMRLENQIPWQVVETIMRFVEVPLKYVAGYARGYLQDRKDLTNPENVTWDDSYKPPHLLGFLRYYMVGRRSDTKKLNLPETVSFSVSAIELAEMGIEVTVNEKKDLKRIGLKKGQYNLYVPQVSLDDSRACILVNMAAFELCTTPDFLDSSAAEEDSAVCSYLQLLGVLIDRMEDVHELRRKRVLQGGGGLTNQQVLEFISRLQDLRLGYHYIHLMVGIEDYQRESKLRVCWKSFSHNHGKTVAKVVAGFTTLAGILGTISQLKR